MTEPKYVLTWDEIQTLQDALIGLAGYVSDNSCSDPDCCGGPYYEKAEFDRAEGLLSSYGIKWNGSTE